MLGAKIMKAPSILKLFDSPTTGLISWYLFVYKELNASQISRLSRKSLSTVTRSLKKMEDANLVEVSRIEQVKNLSKKYWRLNPNIKLEENLIQSDELNKLPSNEQQQIITQIQNILLIFREITRTIFNVQIRELTNIIQEQKSREKGLFTLFLLDKDEGPIFIQKLNELTESVREVIKPQSKPQSEKVFEVDIDGFIDLDNHIFILLSSRVGDIVPKLKK